MTTNPERQRLSELFDRLFPICRSITGEGFRQSLTILTEHIPLDIESVPSGTPVFDWTVPEEWIVRDAHLIAPDGRRVADFKKSNLSVVNYSMPVHRTLSKQELLPYLHTIPELPDAVPYVTSYYKRNWGFCLSHNEFLGLKDGNYEAVIDSEFKAGFLNFGHLILPGESKHEVLLTSYLCHPSLANNELSGPLALTALYQRIAGWERRRFTYRFLINPETIGSICYLWKYGEHLRKHLYSGLVLTCVGGRDRNSISIKLARKNDAPVNSLVRAMVKEGKVAWRFREFDPTSGSDERQFCSPGFDLPVAQVARSVYGQYPGYHNSLDTKEFMSVDCVVQSVDEIERLLRLMEIAGCYQNQQPFGEVQLGKRGLYPNVNSTQNWSKSSDRILDGRQQLNAILMILNYSDGRHSMLEIAEKCGLPLESLRPVIERLESEKLLGIEKDAL